MNITLKAYKILVSICTSFSCAYSQSNEIPLKKFVVITTTFVDKNGKAVINYERGGGFIIDGNFVATCYHVIYPPELLRKQYKPKRVRGNYNFRKIKDML